MLGSLGTPRDKTEAFYFEPDLIDWACAERIYRGDALAARIIETKPNELFREGYELCVSGPGNDNKSIQEAVENEWAEIGLMSSLRETKIYSRAYGGGGMLMGVNDGATDLSQPVNPKAIKRGTKGVTFLTSLEPRELTPVRWYGDPTAKQFGKPALYQLNPSVPGAVYGPRSKQSLITVHESRLIIFPGIKVTERLQTNNGGWGDSVLTRVFRVLRNFNISLAAAGVLVADFAQAVYKMKGLNDIVQDDPKDSFKQRMLAMNMARDVARAVLIDADDSFTREATPVTGLPDLLDRFASALASAADLPLPLLLGESPGGINASGASGDQLRMFYDKIAAEQKHEIVPAIKKVSSFIMLGMGIAPEVWSVKPCPLWQLTEKEKAETRKIQADTDAIYIDRGALRSDEVRTSRFGGDAYSADTVIINTTPTAVNENVPGETPVQTAASTSPVTVEGAPQAEIQKTAMNGAQVSSLLEVIRMVASKQISRESGLATLQVAFQVAPEQAASLLGPDNFEPVAQAPDTAMKPHVTVPPQDPEGSQPVDTQP